MGKAHESHANAKFYDSVLSTSLALWFSHLFSAKGSSYLYDLL